MNRLLFLSGFIFLLVFHLNNTKAIAGRWDVLKVVPADTLPTPKGIKNLLFYVQRDPNINTVIYELNLDLNGQIDDKEPVKIYWIRYAEKGEKKDLSYIQRKFAYGLDVKKLSNEKYEIKFVSYSKLPLYLQKGNDGKYKVFAQINQKQSVLNRVFVRIKGGTFWVPNVVYVDLIGKDPNTNQNVSRRINP